MAREFDKKSWYGMTKPSRTRNAGRNLLFGELLKLYQIIMPFILRTCMIYFMGIEYLGLSSLFVSILQVLNLAELGVASAMVYSMYKPISEEDYPTICALLKLYRQYYRIIGTAVAAIGLLLLPVVPYLVKGSIPNGLNLQVLYLLNLGATVLSYWLFAYKTSLLQAHQRSDMISRVTLATNTFMYVCQIAIIIVVKDFYLYVMAALVTQILTNVAGAVCATRLYPHLKPVGTLEKEQIRVINQRIKDLFTSKIGAAILSAGNTLVISIFLGLTALAIYQNYYFIVVWVSSIVGVAFTACVAGIGNSIITESKEKNFKDLRKFTFILTWIIGFFACCILCLCQPFMEIWVGNSLMLEFPAVAFFAVYFFVFNINLLLSTYKDAAGIWHEDRFRPLVTSIFSILLSLVLVNSFGVYGVALATPLSQLAIAIPWLLKNLFTYLFEPPMLRIYLKKIGYYAILMIAGCVICYMICSMLTLPPMQTLIFRALVCFIFYNSFYFAFTFRSEDFHSSLATIEFMTKGKIGFLGILSNRLSK